jgi:uncharacterized protein (DUF433 family)
MEYVPWVELPHRIPQKAITTRGDQMPKSEPINLQPGQNPNRNGVDLVPEKPTKKFDEQTIQKTPGAVGGEARIRNTRIPVWSLIQLQRIGSSDTEIKSAFEEPLTDSDLSAAREYYKNNKQEIDEAIECNEAD